MKPPVIGQKINEPAIDSLIDVLDQAAGEQDVLYIGYPVAATVEAPITVPALLISLEYGLVCFDVVPSAKPSDVADVKARQRTIVLALKAKLLQHPDLAGEYDLAFKINIITYALAYESSPELVGTHVADAGSLPAVLQECSPFPQDRLKPLNAAIERVANIRPKSKRLKVKVATSKGGILKTIE